MTRSLNFVKKGSKNNNYVLYHILFNVINHLSLTLKHLIVSKYMPINVLTKYFWKKTHRTLSIYLERKHSKTFHILSYYKLITIHTIHQKAWHDIQQRRLGLTKFCRIKQQRSCKYTLGTTGNHELWGTGLKRRCANTPHLFIKDQHFLRELPCQLPLCMTSSVSGVFVSLQLLLDSLTLEDRTDYFVFSINFCQVCKSVLTHSGDNLSHSLHHQ